MKIATTPSSHTAEASATPQVLRGELCSARGHEHRTELDYSTIPSKSNVQSVLRLRGKQGKQSGPLTMTEWGFLPLLHLCLPQPSFLLDVPTGNLLASHHCSGTVTVGLVCE